MFFLPVSRSARSTDAAMTGRQPKRPALVRLALEHLEDRLAPAGFVPGSIQGQDGWSGGNIPISPNVVQTVDQTGSHAHAGVGAWLVSNSTANGGYNGNFNGWPFGPGLSVAAGQPSSGAGANQFNATFFFQTASAVADGSNIEVDLGSSAGDDRNTFLAITNDTAGHGGLQLRMAEPDGATGNFFPTQIVATNISRATYHRIDIQAIFINGQANDTFQVSLDGVPITNPTPGSPNFGTTNWGTFEGFRDGSPGSTYVQSNRLFWRSGAAASAFDASFSDTAAQGFYFDDVGYRVSNQSAPSTVLASYTATFEPVAAGTVTVVGSGGDDTLIITATGPNSGSYTLNGNAPVPFSNISKFSFFGQGGNDTLILNNVPGGLFTPTDGVYYDGGPGANTLTVNAAGAPAATRPGQVLLGDPLTITYVNVGAVNVNNAGAVSAIAGPDTADRATAFIGLTANERFVQALYLDELGRAGAKVELDGWVALLDGTAGARAFVAASIEHSSEARTNLVKSWYKNYLGRQAFGGEEQGWVALLGQGQPEEQVLSQILASPEFYNRAQTLIGSGTPDQRYVDALYQLLLKRTASAGETTGAVNALAQVGRQGLALSFLKSQEFRTYQFDGYYDALLHRPSDPAGLNGWVFSNLDVANVRVGFETATEFYFNG